MANKSVLIDATVSIADNNVRRNVATVRANANSPNGAVNTVDTNVLPVGGTYSYTCIPDNKLTFVKTSKPLTVDVNQGSTSYSMLINSLWVISDEIVDLTFQNDGADPAQLLIIQT